MITDRSSRCSWITWITSRARPSLNTTIRYNQLNSTTMCKQYPYHKSCLSGFAILPHLSLQGQLNPVRTLGPCIQSVACVCSKGNSRYGAAGMHSFIFPLQFFLVRTHYMPVIKKPITACDGGGPPLHYSPSLPRRRCMASPILH